MSTFEDNPDVAYTQFDIAVEEEDIVSSNFKWLDKCMMYILCVPLTPNNTERSRCCRLFIISLNTLIFLTCLGLIAFASYYLIVEADIDLLEDTAFMFYFYISSLSRLLSLYYFYFHFNYPWYSKLQLATRNNNYCTIRVLYVIVKLCILIETGVLIIPLILFCFYNDEGIYYILIGSMLIAMLQILWFIPNFVIFIIQCSISFKFQSYLWYLSELINNTENIDLNDLFTQYKLIYHEFNNDYGAILKLSIQMNIVPALFFLWIDVYRDDDDENVYYQMNDVYTYGNLAVVIVLYISSGCYLSETFESLRKSLWRYIEENCEGDNNQSIQSMGAILIAYIKDHPVHITFAKLRITKRNTLIFVVGFALSRLASKLVESVY